MDYNSGRKLAFVIGDETCFCAVGAVRRPPEAEDFTVAINNNVQALSESGALRSGIIDEIEKTIQVDDNAPSASPTDFPTVSPSAGPSVSPTESPMPSPSPSEFPTLQPSITPSPTRSPAPTESPQPSPSPSEFPTQQLE
jgi:hypothetical protein